MLPLRSRVKTSNNSDKGNGDSGDSQDPSLHFGKKDGPLCLQSPSADDIQDVPLAPTKRAKKKFRENR